MLQVITAQGRGAVGGDPEGAKFPWHPELIMDLEASFQQFLQTPCVVVLMGGCLRLFTSPHALGKEAGVLAATS